MSSPIPRPLPANPFAWLLNDIDTANDLDAVVPGDPALLGRILDGPDDADTAGDKPQ